MIQYCQKLYFPQISFFSLFPHLISFPISKPFDFFPLPTGGGELNYVQACIYAS